MKEVIRQEGGKWVLYTKDGSKKLGTFDTEEEAKERERQIQFFKSQGSARVSDDLVASLFADDSLVALLVEKKHSKDWHSCWSKVQSQGYSKGSAAAICTWSLKKTGSVYASERPTTEAIVTLTLDEIADDVLSAELEAEGVTAIKIDTSTWEISKVSAAPATEAPGVPNIADSLESEIHSSFTMSADDLFRRGRINRDERIALSGLIGEALNVFSERVDETLPALRTTALHGEEEVTTVYAAISETWGRSVTEARLDEQGNLSGVIVVEGESANGNVYTEAALQSGVEYFRDRPIYADHPTLSESRERPERSVRDLVGRLPAAPGDIWVDMLAEGTHKGRQALFYRNAVLSESADWLKTLIREGIAGDMSINASGAGDQDETGRFVVESFVEQPNQLISLDFVTAAAAGGSGNVRESATHTDNEQATGSLEALTFETLAAARPDIVDDIAKRERAKAYGEKAQITEMKERLRMSKKLSQQVQDLRASVAVVQREARKRRASDIIAEATVGMPPTAAARVRRLLEGDVRRFVEQEAPPTEGAPPAEAIEPDPALEPSSPPEITVPEQVPEDKRTAWVTAYLAAVEGGMEPDAAVHVAWAEILKAGAEMPAEEMPPAEEVPTAMTEEALRARVKSAVQSERVYLSEMTGAGSIIGMGEAQNPRDATPERAEQALTEAFTGLLPDGMVKDATRGRNRL